MRIEKLRFLDDYKCITGNYCALVGLNGSGKTSIMDCLHFSLSKTWELSKIFFDNSFYTSRMTPKWIIQQNNSFHNAPITNSIEGEINILYVNQCQIDIVCAILQMLNDPIIEKYNLKKEYIEKWRNEGKEIYQESTKCEASIYVFMLNKIFDSRLKLKYKDFANLGIKGFIRKSIGLYLNMRYIRKEGFITPQMERYSRLNCKKRVTKIDENEFASSNLSDGQIQFLILKLIMYLADEDTWVLLDEPDANLDIQKKKEVFEMIKSCKGQVFLTTHDPIMTKWMKGHLIFMKDGKQIPSDMVETINELSDGEVSFQETLLMFQKEYVVVVEGKSDLECIEKAIRSNGLTSEFEQVFFLAQNSASSTQATFDNFLSKVFENHNHIKHILFLYDADDAGYKGKKQIEKIKEEYNDKDISKIIDYLFYRPCYNSTEKSSFDNNIKDYFYLEGYFPVDCYPANNGETINLIKHQELYDILDDKSEDKYLNFNEIIRLKFFAEKINKNGLKSYFGNHTDKIDEKYFVGFRPLLDKILEKLELPNDPTA